MKLLILGGTRFLGRALVYSAQARGHEITLFNRGKSAPDLFPEIEQITGDRTSQIDRLQGRRWDAVIDTCGFEPGVVRQSARQLAGSVDQYTFISSISAYADVSQPGVSEGAPLERLPEGVPETFDIQYYGALKALCEQAAEAELPGRVLNVRPGLIVGDHDATDRFTYWPWRIQHGSEVLAPGRPEHLTQFIDVRDLAEWILRMVESNQVGIYNATGPDYPLTLGDLFETCRKVTGSDAHFTWVSEEFLLENKVEPWSELPLWLPESDPTQAGFDRISIAKALAAGLTFRPLESTIRSTLNWANSRPPEHEWRAGMKPEKEAELLFKAAR